MHKNRLGKIYLIPVPIAPYTQDSVIPSQVKSILQKITYFLVENVRTARRYLAACGERESLDSLNLVCINQATDTLQLGKLMEPIWQGKDIGILSEAGCPGVADPGTLVVQYAHQYQIEVIPLVGPCSLLLALMASGLNGQNFAFQGYLPIDKEQRKKAIKQLEHSAWQLGQTQLFIETPYRNHVVFAALLEACQPNTLLCIGTNLTAQTGWIQTQAIRDWKQKEINLYKIPAVFLLGKPLL